MLNILTLIKREIYDNLHYFILVLLLSAFFILVSIKFVYNLELNIPQLVLISYFLLVMLLLTIGFATMGVSQMYTDKNRGISAFLSTLPVTRDQILIARIITGILAILTLFLPLATMTIILYKLVAPPIPIYQGLFFDIFTLTTLMNIACYCIGLLFGWSSSKLPTIGGLVLVCVLLPLVVVKGLGLSISAILFLFIIASLTRIRQKFLSTSL